MFRFVSGLMIGVYIGSNYECRPHLKKIEDWVKKNTPPKKDSRNNSWEK